MGALHWAIARRNGRRVRGILDKASQKATPGMRFHIEAMEPRVLLSLAGPVGAETAVNSFVSQDQQDPAVAMNSGGDCVVAWQSEGQDGSGWGIYAQQFDAAGAMRGAEIQVNSTTDSWQTNPRVGLDEAGDFVVVWESAGQDGSLGGIYGQRFGPDGAKQGEEFRINTTTEDWQYQPAVAMGRDGGFVVAWTSRGSDGSGDGICTQLYSASGEALGGELHVNTHTAGDQSNPEVGIDGAGDFVVTWQSYGEDGDGWGIFGQRFNAEGKAAGDEFRVNTTTGSWQSEPAVMMNGTGESVVSWQSLGQDGSGWGVYAQRYDAAGLAEGDELRVNSFWAGNQKRPGVALERDGGFAIVWQSEEQDGSGYGVYVLRFTSAGVAEGPEARVNSSTAQDQGNAAVAASEDGRMVVVWQSQYQDGSGEGIYAQRFERIDSPVSVGDWVWNDSNANGVQDAREAGLDGVAVDLYTDTGALAGSTVTAGGGLYRFGRGITWRLRRRRGLFSRRRTRGRMIDWTAMRRRRGGRPCSL